MAASVAEEERGAAGVLTVGGAGVDGGAGGRKLFVDGFGRDVAARDVDDIKAGALA